VSSIGERAAGVPVAGSTPDDDAGRGCRDSLRDALDLRDHRLATSAIGIGSFGI
jgi:hypothetical protein